MADVDVRICGEVAGVHRGWLADGETEVIHARDGRSGFADCRRSTQRRGRSGITPRWERRGVALTPLSCARRDHLGGPDAGGPE